MLLKIHTIFIVIFSSIILISCSIPLSGTKASATNSKSKIKDYVHVITVQYIGSDPHKLNRIPPEKYNNNYVYTNPSIIHYLGKIELHENNKIAVSYIGKNRWSSLLLEGLVFRLKEDGIYKDNMLIREGDEEFYQLLKNYIYRHHFLFIPKNIGDKYYEKKRMFGDKALAEAASRCHSGIDYKCTKIKFTDIHQLRGNVIEEVNYKNGVWEGIKDNSIKDYFHIVNFEYNPYRAVQSMQHAVHLSVPEQGGY